MNPGVHPWSANEFDVLMEKVDQESDAAYKLSIKVLGSTKDSISVKWCTENNDDVFRDNHHHHQHHHNHLSTSTNGLKHAPSLSSSSSRSASDVITTKGGSISIDNDGLSHSTHHHNRRRRRHRGQRHDRQQPINSTTTTSAATTTTPSMKDQSVQVVGQFRISYQPVGSSLLRYSDPVDVDSMETAGKKAREPWKRGCLEAGLIDIARLHENTNYDICIELLGADEAIIKDRSERSARSTSTLETRERPEHRHAARRNESIRAKRQSRSLTLPSSSYRVSPRVHVDQRCVTGSTVTGSFTVAVGSAMGAFLTLAFIVFLVFLAKHQKRSMAARRSHQKSLPGNGIGDGLDGLISGDHGEDYDGGKVFHVNVDGSEVEFSSSRLFGLEVIDDPHFERRRSSAAASRSSRSNCPLENETETKGSQFLQEASDGRRNSSIMAIPFILLVDEDGAYAAIDCEPEINEDGLERMFYAATSNDDVIVDVHRSLEDTTENVNQAENGSNDEMRHRGNGTNCSSFQPFILVTHDDDDNDCVRGLKHNVEDNPETPSSNDRSDGKEEEEEEEENEKKRKKKTPRKTLMRSVGFDDGDDDDDVCRL